jgi:hypothetical protein
MKVLLFFASVAFAEKDYRGFKVLRASWESLEQTELVGSVLERLNTIDLWQPDSLEDIKFTQTVDFIVSQEEAFEFERRVGNATDVRTVTLIEDAGELIAEQSVEQKRATKGLRGAS